MSENFDSPIEVGFCGSSPVEEPLEIPALSDPIWVGKLKEQLQASLQRERRLREERDEQQKEIERLNLLDAVVLLWRAEKAESRVAVLEGLLRDALLALPVLLSVLEEAGLTGANIAYDMHKRITATLTRIDDIGGLTLDEMKKYLLQPGQTIDMENIGAVYGTYENHPELHRHTWTQRHNWESEPWLGKFEMDRVPEEWGKMTGAYGIPKEIING